jgi:hypothetical protein
MHTCSMDRLASMVADDSLSLQGISDCCAAFGGASVVTNVPF